MTMDNTTTTPKLSATQAAAVAAIRKSGRLSGLKLDRNYDGRTVPVLIRKGLIVRIDGTDAHDLSRRAQWVAK